MFIIGFVVGIIVMSKVKVFIFMSYLRMLVYLLILYIVGYYGLYLVGSLIL